MKSQILKIKYRSQLDTGLITLVFGGMIAVVCGCQSVQLQSVPMSLNRISSEEFKENIQKLRQCGMTDVPNVTDICGENALFHVVDPNVEDLKFPIKMVVYSDLMQRRKWGEKWGMIVYHASASGTRGVQIYVTAFKSDNRRVRNAVRRELVKYVKENPNSQCEKWLQWATNTVYDTLLKPAPVVHLHETGFPDCIRVRMMPGHGDWIGYLESMCQLDLIERTGPAIMRLSEIGLNEKYQSALYPAFCDSVMHLERELQRRSDAQGSYELMSEISNEVLQRKKQLKEKVDAERRAEAERTFGRLGVDEIKRMIEENPVRQEKCVARLINLAKVGDVKAMGVLGEIFLWDGDYDKAAYWSNMAVEKSDGCGFAVRGVLKQNGRGGYVKSGKEAYICLQRSAERGCVMGVLQLGLSHEMGWGCERSAEKAVDFYRKAAELGCGEAMYRLGWCHLHGVVVEESKSKAGEWFLKSANVKCANGMTALALSYLSGWGVPKDKKQAEKLLKEAVEMKHNDWALKVAGGYYLDNGNEEKALGYYSRYAGAKVPDRDFGMFKAQKITMELARGKHRGNELLTVVNGAIAELMKLSDSKDEWTSRHSSLELARIFETGYYGVEKNQMEALRWYEKASVSGDKDAVEKLEQFERGVFDETTIKERVKLRRKRIDQGNVEVNWYVRNLMKEPYWPVRGSSLFDDEVVKDGELVGLFGICLGQDATPLFDKATKEGCKNSVVRLSYNGENRFISWQRISFDVFPVRFDRENPVIGVMAERRFDSERCAMSAAENRRTAIKNHCGIVIEVDPSVKDGRGWIRILKQKDGDVILSLKVEKRYNNWYLVYSLSRRLEDSKCTNPCGKRLMTLLAREGNEIVGMFGVRLGQDVSSLAKETIGEFLGEPILLSKENGGGMLRRYDYKGNRGVWDDFAIETFADRQTIRKVIATKEYQEENVALSAAAEFRDFMETKHGVSLTRNPLAKNVWLQIFEQERNTVLLAQKVEKDGRKYVLSYSMSAFPKKNDGE